jgi:hypothetical protein
MKKSILVVLVLAAAALAGCVGPMDLKEIAPTANAAARA